MLKLWRDPTASARVAEEARRTTLLAEAGVRVAEVREQVAVDGRPGLLLERVDGVDLARLLARRPWTVDAVAAELATVQADLHAREAPAGLPALHDLVAQRLRQLPPDRRRTAERQLAALHRGNRLLHGNLHLGNAVRSGSGCVLVDWGDVAHGAPAAEVAHTLVRYRVAQLRAEAPPWVRALSGPGRTVLRVRYLHHYLRRAALDRRELAAWLPVRAAERLAEGNAGEERALLALLRG